MNKQIAVPNNGESAIFVGGVMIPPGETRHFDESMLPPEFKPDAEPEGEAAVDNPLLVISALSIPQLALGLPDLSDEELAALEGMENDKEKPRQGALAAILAERLCRSEARTPGGMPESTDETQGNGSGEGSGD